jgi:Tfp pilus assembly protein PilE
LRYRKPSGGCAGYGVVETAIVVIAVAVLIAIVVNHYGRSITKTRDTAIRSELATLRNTINLFSAVNGRCPANLQELIKAEFALPYKTGPVEVKKDEESKFKIEEKIFFKPEYLKSYALDEEGNILDPFGSPYAYDPMQCSVHALTSGYELL